MKLIKHFSMIFFLTTGINALSQNVMISNISNPNEPSIMMDPENLANIIAGANINKYYISRDTGRTWTTHFLSSSHGVWGDPVIAVDTAGDFYFFHLSNPQSGGNWIDRIVCQKTMDVGETWNDGSYTGLNGTKAQDKQWVAIDRKSNIIYMTWTQFDKYGSPDPSDSSLILFSRSLDAGLTWSEPLRLSSQAGDCIDSDNTVEGAVPTVGLNGEVYVSWAGPDGIVFNKSLDGGVTWLDHETPVDPMPTGWDYHIPGITRSNGLPVTICDTSQSAYRGTIYINWSDQRNGSDDTDIWLAKSTDEGVTWTTPIRVNDDSAGKHQFFTWMAIDQTNGYLYFIFYDRRDQTGDWTHVYLAVSKDGGNTFINRKISESPFLPNSGIFFGDYTNITVHDGIVRPIWTRLHEGALSIWTHLTTEEIILSIEKEDEANNLNIENYPNPTSEDIYVSFKLPTLSTINLSILDTKGNLLHKIIEDEKRGFGKYVEKIDVKKLNLSAGIYLLQLKVNDHVKTLKQIIIN